MFEPCLAEIQLWPLANIPKGWMACEGQILPINQNVALFSLLGTTYGGDGVRTFALPDLRGRVPVGANGSYALGMAAGEAAHTLTLNELPQHTHMVQASATDASAAALVAGETWAAANGNFGPPASIVAMAPGAVSVAGNNQPHNNMQPYTALCFCIATTGEFPSRN